jgi:hypothetical protein
MPTKKTPRALLEASIKKNFLQKEADFMEDVIEVGESADFLGQDLDNFLDAVGDKAKIKELRDLLDKDNKLDFTTLDWVSTVKEGEDKKLVKEVLAVINKLNKREAELVPAAKVITDRARVEWLTGIVNALNEFHKEFGVEGDHNPDKLEEKINFLVTELNRSFEFENKAKRTDERRILDNMIGLTTSSWARDTRDFFDDNKERCKILLNPKKMETLETLLGELEKYVK